MSNKSQYYFDRFQKFMRSVHLFMGAEFFCVAIVVLITRPRPSSLFFIIPISILVLSFIAYCASFVYFFTPFCRAALEQRRLRKRGLPIDSTDPGPWLTMS
jgi:hypothetical protein